ncbi:DMT family transporter [Pseudomonas sp. PSKL.D1]|uniref:DMT family transporter n=1 Tax=Pseudomonas sp. PSKL.D1 TaxID=3029060 RepID=UPI0023817E7D|nr:EamA family transporter [Pseudomonas sp. PSKL.D1]WDY56916.1 EamA family transporter [Pseudomonas sp. PSKL.D1]
MKVFTQSTAGIREGGAGAKGNYMWLLLMVLLWGASWPVTKLALESVPPLWLAAIRFASAALCLFGYLIIRGQLTVPVRADVPILLSVAFLQMMAFTGLGMLAMVHIDTSRAVLLAYTTPLWCVLLSWLAFRQVPSRLQGVALVVGMSGVAVVCSPAELNWASSDTRLGALFLVLAAVCWAVVILHVKRHQWVSAPIALAPWQMLIAAVPLSAIAYASEGPPTSITLDTSLLQLLFFIGPVATSACFVISSEYGRRVSTFSMSNFTLGVPLVGGGVSYAAFGNTVTPAFILGLCLVVFGVVLSAIGARGTD